MSDGQTILPKPQLGIGVILSRVLNGGWDRFAMLFAVAFCTDLIVTAIWYVIPEVAPAEDTFSSDTWMFYPFNTAYFYVSAIIEFALGGVVAALLTHCALTTRTGDGLSLGAGLRAVVVLLPFIVIYAIVTNVLTTLGLLMLIVPGLYIWARWSVYLPILMTRRVPMGSVLPESARLTQGVRWAIVVVIIVALAVAFGVSLAIELLSSFVALGDGTFGDFSAFYPASDSIYYTLGYAFKDALIHGFRSLIVALVIVEIFLRLLEIEDGGEVDTLRKIFS